MRTDAPTPRWARHDGKPSDVVPEPSVLYAALARPDDYLGWWDNPDEARTALEASGKAGIVEQWFWKTDNLGQGWCAADAWEDERGPVRSQPVRPLPRNR